MFFYCVENCPWRSLLKHPNFCSWHLQTANVLKATCVSTCLWLSNFCIIAKVYFSSPQKRLPGSEVHHTSIFFQQLPNRSLWTALGCKSSPQEDAWSILLADSCVLADGGFPTCWVKWSGVWGVRCRGNIALIVANPQRRGVSNHIAPTRKEHCIICVRYSLVAQLHHLGTRRVQRRLWLFLRKAVYVGTQVMVCATQVGK